MLSGLQGSFFRPLATAFMVAVGLSLLVALSATPALCALLMGRYVPRPAAPRLRRCNPLPHPATAPLPPPPPPAPAPAPPPGAPPAAVPPTPGARVLPG